MTGSAGSAREEWRKHWGLVLASSIGFGYFAMVQASAGLFMQPLGDEFGWDRAQVVVGISLSALILALLSPFFGILIDKWGTRPLALPGIILTGASIASFSLANGSMTQWLALWVVNAVVSLSVKSTVWTAAVSGVFDRGRGLAIGLTLSGTALAQILVPPIGNWLIENHGWRAAYVWLSVGWGAVTLLLCFFFLRDAHDLKREQAKAAPNHVAPPLPGLSLSEAWRSSALWRIAISTFLIMTLTQAIQVHQFPLLTEAGISRADAAWMVSLTGVAAIAGKLITGWLIDRSNASLVGGITLASSALAFVLLLEPIRTQFLIVLAMLINGYAAGTKMQIAGFMTARYVGHKNFGKIYGVIASIIAIGAALGPLLGGVLYTIYGNYTLLLLVGVVACLAGGALIAGLGRQPNWNAQREGLSPQSPPA